MSFLSWLGLILVCYGLWYLVSAVVEDITERRRWKRYEEIVRMMPPPPPDFIPVRRGPYDWEQES